MGRNSVEFNKNIVKRCESIDIKLSNGSKGWPWPFPWPVITFSTKVYTGSGALHSNSEDEFLTIANNIKPDIIIQNGFSSNHEDYLQVLNFKENLVLFKNRKNSVANVSLSGLSNVLSGEVVNWNELGGDNEEIKIFRFSPKSKNSRNFPGTVNHKHQLSLGDLDLSSKFIHEVGSYKELSSLGKRNKGALIIGLRQEKAADMNLLDVENSIRDGSSYPLGCDVRVLFKKEIENRKKAKNYLRSLKKGMSRDSKKLIKPLMKSIM